MKIYGTTKDNENVYYHPQASHPHRDDLIEEAISKIALNGRNFVFTTVDFGRIVGEDHCVETAEDDVIVYYQRPKHAGKTRFVLNRTAKSTSKVTVGICRGSEEDGEYNGKAILFTLFEGDPGEKEPWDPSLKTDEQKQKAEAFWQAHAIVPTEEERRSIQGL